MATNQPAPVTIRSLAPADRGEWLRMRGALWPRHDPAELAQEIADYDSAGKVAGLPTAVFVAARDDAGGTAGGALGGFVEVSLRALADGCVTSPVGYVEGWYVDADLRRRGVGRALVRAAEEWARSRGCREMGSDLVSDNHVSHLSHLALGYRAARRCIDFAKPLGEAALSPGDAARDCVALVPYPITVGAAVGFVTDPVAGGIDVFLGTTRAEAGTSGADLIALDYEAYAEMAERQMRDLARRARDRWPVTKLVLLHRVGRVAVGEPSVLIAVSAPHRAEAFEACRWLIDTLKAEVAIWKKEVWSDGAGTWVHPGGEGVKG